MKLKVTGDIDFIAHSAWISTIGEMRASARTREDQERVVKFLVEHNHTSPLEGVTLTFDASNTLSDEELLPEDADLRTEVTWLSRNKYAREGSYGVVTIDLLNFCKASMCDPFGTYGGLWSAFEEQRPKLAELLKGFSTIKEDFSEPVEDIIGGHNMSVQLVQLHEAEDRWHCRASWRIRCPLSISVQLLRHRKISANQTSGRYRTIRHNLFETPDDFTSILDKVGCNSEDYMDNGRAAIKKYLDLMNAAKISRDDKVISNDEYKRLREVARFILPEGRMTELYVTFYLDDFYDNYLKLRDSKHAQTEHIYIAQEMRRTLEERTKKS